METEHCDAFDYWGKGTQVTVSNDVPTAPSSILTFRDCGQSTDTVTLGCLAKDFMPGIVTFNWTNVGTEIIQYPPVLGNGKYTGFSQVSIPRSDWDRASSFNCTVEHSAGIKFATIDKKVPKSIVILMSQPHEDNDTQYLTCIMKDFATKDFTVKWKKNNNVVVGQTWAAQADSGLYSASSLLTVSMTDWNSKTEYTCEVSHKGQVFTKKISNVQCPGPAGKDRQSTRDSGEVPTVSVHLLPEEDVDKLANMGEVTLICLVTSSYPCDYFIKWRENEGQYKNGVTSPPQRTPDGSKYLVTSVYTTTKASWMSNKVTCAALNGLDNSMAPTKQRGVTKDLGNSCEYK